MLLHGLELGLLIGRQNGKNLIGMRFANIHHLRPLVLLLDGSVITEIFQRLRFILEDRSDLGLLVIGQRKLFGKFLQSITMGGLVSRSISARRRRGIFGTENRRRRDSGQRENGQE